MIWQRSTARPEDYSGTEAFISDGAICKGVSPFYSQLADFVVFITQIGIQLLGAHSCSLLFCVCCNKLAVASLKIEAS